MADTTASTSTTTTTPAIEGVSDKAIESFAVFANAIRGATTAYEGFGLSAVTVSKQFSGFVDAITNTSAFRAATDQAGFLSNAMKMVGMQVPYEILNKGVAAVKAWAEAAFQNADNMIRLQNEYIKMSAVTGNLKEVLGKAKEDLSHMNDLVFKQSIMMNAASSATGVNAKEVATYYQTLAAVPGALDANIKGLSGQNTNMSMLTATIKLAHGTGREFKDVVEDLTKAYQEYGLTGERALQFTAKLTETSKELGIPFKEIQGSLEGLAAGFGSFVRAGESAFQVSEQLANITNRYVRELKEAGATNKEALKVSGEMIDNFKKLDVAQRAFLSQQTGGPGGLMGAFEIEKMLREGNVEGIREKVETTLKRQFGGRVVSLEEAAGSEQMARQRQMQMQMLTQGPLGAMFQTKESASWFLDAMSKGEKGEIPGLKELQSGDKALQDAVNTGNKIEEKSYTIFASMSADVEGMSRNLDILTLNSLQKSGFTAGAGVEGSELPEEMKVVRSALLKKVTSDEFSAKYMERPKEGGPLITTQYLSETATKFAQDTKLLGTSVEGMAKYTFNFSDQLGKTNKTLKDIEEDKQKYIALDKEKGLSKEAHEEYQRKIKELGDQEKSYKEYQKILEKRQKAEKLDEYDSSEGRAVMDQQRQKAAIGTEPRKTRIEVVIRAQPGITANVKSVAPHTDEEVVVTP